VDPPGAAASADANGPERIRLLLARDALLTIGEAHVPIEVNDLRNQGVNVQGTVIRTETLPPPPEVDRAFYQALASANTDNAAINDAAGRYFGDDALKVKRDSLYAPLQFERILAYFKSGEAPPEMRGVIYVAGGVALQDRARLRIAEGSLVAESTVLISESSTLEITHSAATRSLPSVVTLGNGALYVTEQAEVRVHGLIYANRVIDVGEGAVVDVVGGILGNDRGLSFRNLAATVVIRYDPAVLGTPGLRAPDGSPVLAWIVNWDVLP
jgi:hypothetical protein